MNQFGSQFTPFASRTFQYTKEQLGQAEDKVGFPEVEGSFHTHFHMLTIAVLTDPAPA